MIFQVKWTARGFQGGFIYPGHLPRRTYGTIYTFTSKPFRNHLDVLIILCISFLEIPSNCTFLDEEDMEKESCPTLGEGGDSGGLIPGKSLVFSTMELLMFILVRHMPHLSTKMSDSPSHVATKTRLSEESARLVAATVAILSDLPSLCSPAGTVPISVWECAIRWGKDELSVHFNLGFFSSYISGAKREVFKGLLCLWEPRKD